MPMSYLIVRQQGDCAELCIATCLYVFALAKAGSLPERSDWKRIVLMANNRASSVQPWGSVDWTQTT